MFILAQLRGFRDFMMGGAHPTRVVISVGWALPTENIWGSYEVYFKVVKEPSDWEYSSFLSFVDNGFYDAYWCDFSELKDYH